MANISTPPTLLVTGGSGFVALHLILQLLKAGYTVRTTVRNESPQPEILDAIRQTGIDPAGRLSFAFPSSTPHNEDEVLRPAQEGTIRVLKFARDAGVRRVIITSSFAAIGYGHENSPKLSEDNWSIIDGSIRVPAYQKSKTVAERSAWAFIEKDAGGMELAVVNSTGVFGPVLSKDLSSSIQLIVSMANGKLRACPQISFGIVDVRDLADLHIRAMKADEAKGQRFIAVSDAGTVSMIDVAGMIRDNKPELSQKLPAKVLLNLLVRALALFRAELRDIVPELGAVKEIKNDKAKRLLGWQPRPVEETIRDTVDSLVRYGIVS